MVYLAIGCQNAFLNGFLKETIFIEQPSGFFSQKLPNHVCYLKHDYTGLKQVTMAWFECLSIYLLGLGLFYSEADSSLFILKSPYGIYLFLYMLMI